MSHDGPVLSIGDRGGRRSFLVRLAAVVIGGIVTLFPFLAGLGVFLDPLRRRQAGTPGDSPPDGATFVRIGPLAMLPADGVPRQFAVTADVADAWTRVAGQRVGSVFLARTEDADGSHVTALSATCPHLGCAVDYLATAGHFQCPCHEGIFAKDGAFLAGPSLRGLDPLPVRLIESDGQQEIWLDFQRFRSGVAERIPVG